MYTRFFCEKNQHSEQKRTKYYQYIAKLPISSQGLASFPMKAVCHPIQPLHIQCHATPINIPSSDMETGALRNNPATQNERLLLIRTGRLLLPEIC